MPNSDNFLNPRLPGLLTFPEPSRLLSDAVLTCWSPQGRQARELFFGLFFFRLCARRAEMTPGAGKGLLQVCSPPPFPTSSHSRRVFLCLWWPRVARYCETVAAIPPQPVLLGFGCLNMEGLLRYTSLQHAHLRRDIPCARGGISATLP